MSSLSFMSACRSYTYSGSYAVSKSKDNILRIAVLGAPAVGKSALIKQMLTNQFLQGYSATIQDRYMANIDIDDRVIVLDIFDTPGSYCFANVRKLAIANADAFILVYDVGDESSFEKAVELRDLIVGEKSSDVPILVVGNKTDKDSSSRFMSKDKAECLVTSGWQHHYLEASAKDNKSAVCIFNEIIIQTGHFVKRKGRRTNSLGTILNTLTRKLRRATIHN